MTAIYHLATEGEKENTRKKGRRERSGGIHDNRREKARLKRKKKGRNKERKSREKKLERERKKRERS